MKTIAKNSNIRGTISVPGSKSYANRVLIWASVKKNKCIIKNVPLAKDTVNLIRCLKQVGLDIKEGDDHIVVFNSFPECERSSTSPIKLRTGDGGTTNRFLIPLLAMGKNEYHLYPEGRMIERPMGEFDKYFDSYECRSDHFKIQGPRTPGPVQIDCSLTSQVASAFVLANYDVQVSNFSSSSYLLMTEDVVRNFHSEYHIAADWSCAAFPLVFAALAGEIQIRNFTEADSLQADGLIMRVLEHVGVEYQFSSDGLAVKKNLTCPFQLDCRYSLDLFPALVFLASYLDGESTLSGLDNLKYKESDRLVECISLLEVFDVPHRLEKGRLIIQGRRPDDKARNVTTAKDHRLVMAAYLFLRLNGGGTLAHADQVAKSFPEFFDVMEKPL